jgi:DNA (cytosine-5)-methyltransferase 1
MPLAIVLESVPDSVDYGGENIPEQICHRLSRSVYNYEARWTILEAAEYGVPQYRQRVIVLAMHRSLGVLPEFPSPTHRCAWLEQKARLRGALGRTADTLARRFQNHGGGRYFVPPPAVGSSAITAVSAEDALSDLPQIFTLSSRNLRGSGCSDVSQLLPYHLARPLNGFQNRMRAWAGFETMGWVSGNVIRQTLRDFPTFRSMKQGDNYRQAVKIAMDRFNTQRHQQEQWLGRKLTRSEIAKLKKKIVPPYSLDKFDTKWAMLWRDRPSHTVVAHLQYDTYSHIHYDFQQARAISVREAARLQSIPDGFKFFGFIADSLRQIGNAVPPLLAASIGSSLLSTLRSSAPRKTIKRGAAA